MNSYFDTVTLSTDEDMRKARAIHVLKTVQLLLLQFLFTFGLTTIMVFNQSAYLFTVKHALELVSVGGLGGLLTVIYIGMSTKKTETQLAVFTVFETMLVCAASSMYGLETVMMAMLAMIGIMCGLGSYALTTSTNYTGLASLLFSGLSGLLMMAIVNIFLGSQIVRMFELCCGTLLFFGYIIFDVQYYLSEHSTALMSHRDDFHIEAALNIYLDGLNIFIRLLDLLDLSNNKSNKKIKKDD